MQISNDNETSEEEIMINVAILGYGTVGSGVFEILDTNKKLIGEKSRTGDKRKICFRP